MAEDSHDEHWSAECPNFRDWRTSVVYADWLGATGKPTILVYGHYDVESRRPGERVESPPYEAVERDGNLYGGTAE